MGKKKDRNRWNVSLVTFHVTFSQIRLMGKWWFFYIEITWPHSFLLLKRKWGELGGSVREASDAYFRLGSWSRSLWVGVPLQAPRCQCRGCLEFPLCPSLFAPPLLRLSLPLSLSLPKQINKEIKKWSQNHTKYPQNKLSKYSWVQLAGRSF